MTTGSIQNRRPSFMRRFVILVGGTAVLLSLGAVMMQVMRPITGEAQEKPAAPAGRASVSKTQDEILATVSSGNTTLKVSYDEVARECMYRHGAEVLENLINRKIIEAACQRGNINVNEGEVDQEIVKISKKFNMTVDEWYNMLEAEQNVTKAQYRRDIIWPMLALKKLAGNRIKPLTKTEFDQAFERNYGARVKAKIIVQDNQRRAAEAWQLAQKHPDQFEEIVKKYSIDPSSRALGGAIPPIAHYSGNPLNEPIEEAAFKLKVGEISSVIQSGQQFVILKCEGLTERVVTDQNEVKDQLIADLKEEKTRQAVAETFEDLRAGATIHNYLTNQTINGKRPTTPGTAVPGAAAPGAVRQTSGQAVPGGVQSAGGTRSTAPPRR